jgi:thymidylate synthase (FAD)
MITAQDILDNDPRLQVRINWDSTSRNIERGIWHGQHECVSETPGLDDTPPAKPGQAIIKHQLTPEHSAHYSVLNWGYLALHCYGFPHSTMTQLTRHQDSAHLVQCLAGDTEIYFANSKGVTPAKLRRTISELWDIWHNGEQAVHYAPGSKSKPPRHYRRDMKKRIKKQRVRCLDEKTNEFSTNHIKDVIYKGKQPVYRITLSDGRQISSTLNHRYLTSKGWMSLEDAVRPIRGVDDIAIGFSQDAYLCCNGVTTQFKPGQKPWNYRKDACYRDKDWLKQKLSEGLTTQQIADQAECSPECIKKWVYHHGLNLNKVDKTFKSGFTPWNKNKGGYTLDLSRAETQRRREWAAKNKKGEKCNFWKGGTSSERMNIANWTNQVAARVHRRYQYTCQACGQVGGHLDAHHIIPVFMDERKAYDPQNLVTLCRKCHQSIHSSNQEMVFAKSIKVIDDDDFWAPLPTSSYNKLIPRYLKVESIEYLGIQDVYDLEMEAPNHNFVANSIVVHNSGRYTGQRFVDYVTGNPNKQGNEYHLTDLFYFRPVGTYQDRLGSRYEYEPLWAADDERESHRSAIKYCERIEYGMAEEHARDSLRYNFRQNFAIAGTIEAVFHWLDQRSKKDSQLEIQALALLGLQCLKEAAPNLGQWYEANRYGRARLAP